MEDGETASLLASNVMNTRTFEVKTPDVVIKISPDRTDLIVLSEGFFDQGLEGFHLAACGQGQRTAQKLGHKTVL